MGNRDILLTSVTPALATAIGFLANLIGLVPFAGSAEDDERPGPVATLAAVLVAAGLLQLALSRSREFEADRTGAQLLGDGWALAGALQKIDRIARRVPMSVEPAQAPKYLLDPLTGRAAWASLFSDAPTRRTADRPADRPSLSLGGAPPGAPARSADSAHRSAADAACGRFGPPRRSHGPSRVDMSTCRPVGTSTPSSRNDAR